MKILALERDRETENERALLPTRLGVGARLVPWQQLPLPAEGAAVSDEEPFVAEMLEDRLGFRFRMRQSRFLVFEVDADDDADVGAITWVGGAVEIELRRGDRRERICAAAPDPWTLAGVVPAGVHVRTGLEEDHGGTAALSPPDFTAYVDRPVRGETRFGYGYSAHSPELAVRRATAALDRDAGGLYEDAAGWLRTIVPPPLESQLLEEVYRRAAAAMRSACGEGRPFCDDPSRFDLLVASGAWAHLDPDRGLDLLMHLLAEAGEDGLIPAAAEGGPAALPPLAAGVLLDLAAAGASARRIAEAYPRVKRHVQGWLDRKGRNGLPAWSATEPRGLEAGMEGSARFASGGTVTGADLASMLVREATDLRRIAARIDQEADPELAGIEAAALAIVRARDRHLWNGREGAYLDARDDGSRGSLGIETFVPLWGGRLDDARRRQIVDRLVDPDGFWGALPVPSCVPPGGDAISPWAGGVWPHLNAWICRGLREAGEGARARLLARTTLEAIAHWYGEEGIFFAWYDPANRLNPRTMPGQGDVPGVPMVDPLRTAAAVIALSAEAVARVDATPAEEPAPAVPMAQPSARRSNAPALVAPVAGSPGGSPPRARRWFAGIAAIAIVAAAGWVGWQELPGQLAQALSPGRNGPAPFAGLSPLDLEQATLALDRVADLVRLRRYEEAVDEAAENLARPGASPVLHYWTAAALLRIGDPIGASEAARKFLDARPTVGTDAQRIAARRFLEWERDGEVTPP